MKYQRLLEGLEAVEIEFSELDEPLRIEAEYYKKRYLQIEELLAKLKHELLKHVRIKVTDGTHFTPTYTESGIPFLSALNVLENRLDFSVGHQFISSNEHEFLYTRCDPKPGDILLRKVGVGPRWAAVVPKGVPEFSIFVSVALIRTKPKELRPAYLSTFINSYYGQEQLLRIQKGMSQPDLHLEDINRLVVPIFSDTFQLRIEETIAISEWKFAAAVDYYKQAERTLLAKLGLLDWQPPEPLTYERKASAAFAAGRLDAEHFQEKYLALEKQLGLYSSGTMALGEICLQPVNGVEIREYVEDGVPYLRIGDLQQLDIREDSVVRIDPDAADEVSSKVALNQGDVLVSRSGSLGVTCVVSEDWTGAVISSHLIRIRLTDKRFDPYYVALFLGSMPGKFQIQKRSNGVIQPEINQPALKTIILPILHTEVQKNIRALILQSRKARRTAKALLEQAKRAVEIAIEENEATALEFLQMSDQNGG